MNKKSYAKQTEANNRETSVLTNSVLSHDITNKRDTINCTESA